MGNVVSVVNKIPSIVTKLPPVPPTDQPGPAGKPVATPKDLFIAPGLGIGGVCHFAGPLSPGQLQPPDPRLGAPANVPPSPRGITKDDVMDAATIGAFAITGEAAGMVIGQSLIPIPVVGGFIGGAVGSVAGGLVGLGWRKIFG